MQRNDACEVPAARFLVYGQLQMTPNIANTRLQFHHTARSPTKEAAELIYLGGAFTEQLLRSLQDI